MFKKFFAVLPVGSLLLLIHLLLLLLFIILLFIITITIHFTGNSSSILQNIWVADSPKFGSNQTFCSLLIKILIKALFIVTRSKHPIIFLHYLLNQSGRPIHIPLYCFMIDRFVSNYWPQT